MANDLISREALIADLRTAKGLGLIIAETIVRFLKKQPTVDAVEVVHGQWKYYHKQNKAVCTNCSFERDLDINFGRAISCPNCGADMRGTEE